MIDELRLEKEVYKFLDKNGVPYKDLAQIGLRIELNENDFFQDILRENDDEIEEVYHKGDFIISKFKNQFITQPDLPKTFKLTLKEQVEIVRKWFVETTGFQINDIGVLKEYPVLNGNPFVLQVSRGYNEKWFVLAGAVIKGDLSLSKKYNAQGYLGHNWIKSFGRIEKIYGNLYVDIELRDFGQLKRIHGNLSFSNHVYQNVLSSLSPLVKVDGDVYLKNTHLCLGTLESIGGSLNLRKTTVHDLGNLSEVKGNILLTKSQADKIDLSGVKILGKVKYYNDVFTEGELNPPNY